MAILAITLALRLAAGTPPPEEGPLSASVDIVPGRDVGITRYATWSNHANALLITGVPGAELFIEEALLFDVKSDLVDAVLTVEPVAASGVRTFKLEVWAADRLAGELDLLHPSPTLALGPLEDGSVLGVGVRLALAEDAHDVRDIVMRLHVTG